MKYISLSVIMLYCMALTAETPREVLTEMNKSYLQLNTYSVQFDYKLYTDSKAADPIETVVGQLSRAKNSYRYKMDDMEYIRNEKYMLAIDHTKKLIILNKSSVQIPTPLAFVDTVMANYGMTIKEVPGDKDMYHFVLTPPSTEMQEYERIDMYITRSGKDIRKIVLYLVQQPEGESQAELNGHTIDLKKPRVEIEYQHLTKNLDLGAGFFSESKFLVPGNSGKLVLTPRYSSYKLFNQL